MSKGSAGDFMAGFFFGAIVGAIVALLFAPKSGDEMRAEMRVKSIELKDKADALGEQTAQKAEVLREKGQDLFRGQMTRFQEAIEEGKRAASQKKEELLSQLEHAKTTDSSFELTGEA